MQEQTAVTHEYDLGPVSFTPKKGTHPPGTQVRDRKGELVYVVDDNGAWHSRKRWEKKQKKNLHYPVAEQAGN